MKFKFLLWTFPLLASVSGCGFKDAGIEDPSKRVLFTYQQYNRQVVVGEGLGIGIGFVFAGLPANDRDRIVRYAVDPSLVTGDRRTPLPEDYYRLGNPSEITIPKGQFKAYMSLTVDSAKFVNDPKALTGEYVIPLRIVDADADEISPGKEYTMISLSYQGRQYGNYTYSGQRTIEPTGEVEKYGNEPSQTNSIRQLQTVAADKFRIYADQTGTNDPAKGKFSMIITVPVNGGGKVTVEPDTGFLKDVHVHPDGESVYDESTRTFTLRYRYTLDGVLYRAVDTMKFRNRIRDDQGDGRVLYEWRGF